MSCKLAVDAAAGAPWDTGRGEDRADRSDALGVGSRRPSVSRLRRLRTNSSAPTSSTSESATWVATSTRRRLKRSRPAVMLAAAGTHRRRGRRCGGAQRRQQAEQQAGDQASAAVKPSTRQSSARPTKSGLFGVLRNATRPRLSTCASAAPSSGARTASSRLSASSCRTSRQRDAPIASRTAISRSRTLARASSRFARFAHAISSTRPVVASSSQSGVSYWRRRPETPVAPAVHRACSPDTLGHRPAGKLGAASPA